MDSRPEGMIGRVWCGVCGTYAVEGQKLPCENTQGGFNPTSCGAIGRPFADIEWISPEEVENSQEVADAALEAVREVMEGGHGTITPLDTPFMRALRDQTVPSNLVSEALQTQQEIVAAAAELATARDSQVGGSHYKTLKIQPFEYSLANGLDACQHTAVKYVTRWKEKGGIKDIDKAIHTLQFYKEWAIANGYS